MKSTYTLSPPPTPCLPTDTPPSVGLADNTLLPLATATLTAVQQIGLPEARINLAHCAVALAEARKSIRAYRGLNEVMGLLDNDPLAGGAPVPMHLRNAPTRLMKEGGWGAGYKYNPDYVDGEVLQEVCTVWGRPMRGIELICGLFVSIYRRSLRGRSFWRRGIWGRRGTWS